MNLPENIQYYFDNSITLLSAIEDYLSLWDFTKQKTCQLPTLMDHLQEKYNWDKTQRNNKDALVRDYLRSHKVYDIKRGASGGICLRANEQKKDAEAEAKKQAIADAKKEINDALDTKFSIKNISGDISSIPELLNMIQDDLE